MSIQAAQNVIVELQFKASNSSDLHAKDSNASASPQSVYVGWTGMPSKRKLASVVGRGSQKGSIAGREQEVSMVEVDATFGRMLGFTDGQKVEYRTCASMELWLIMQYRLECSSIWIRLWHTQSTLSL